MSTQLLGCWVLFGRRGHTPFKVLAWPFVTLLTAGTSEHCVLNHGFGVAANLRQFSCTLLSKAAEASSCSRLLPASSVALTLLLRPPSHHTHITIALHAAPHYEHDTVHVYRSRCCPPTLQPARSSPVLHPIRPLAANPRRPCLSRLRTVRASGSGRQQGSFSGLLRRSDAARQR